VVLPIGNKRRSNPGSDRAIQEIQFQTGGFEAEFGRATGGIVNLVTKSGGNQLSGTVDLRYRDQSFLTDGQHRFKLNGYVRLPKDIAVIGRPQLSEPVLSMMESDSRRRHWQALVDPSMQIPSEFNPRLLTSSWAEELFDLISDIVFFIKDTEGRYMVVNNTLVERCGLTDKQQALGRTTADLFPTPLGDRYLEQDRQVCTSGVAMTNCLELHLFLNQSEGWCLTDKLPLHGAEDRIIGLVGLSRDVQLPGESDPRLKGVAAAVTHIQQRFSDELRLEMLAEMAGMSAYQFNRRIRTIFGLTACQLVTKTRIDAASNLLRTTHEPVAAIAIACGYCDQSAFTRQFKATVGITPRQYRECYQD
jgi:AraC-like DNA-binding protein